MFWETATILSEYKDGKQGFSAFWYWVWSNFVLVWEIVGNVRNRIGLAKHLWKNKISLLVRWPSRLSSLKFRSKRSGGLVRTSLPQQQYRVRLTTCNSSLFLFNCFPSAQQIAVKRLLLVITTPRSSTRRFANDLAPRLSNRRMHQLGSGPCRASGYRL